MWEKLCTLSQYYILQNYPIQQQQQQQHNNNNNNNNNNEQKQQPTKIIIMQTKPDMPYPRPYLCAVRNIAKRKRTPALCATMISGRRFRLFFRVFFSFFFSPAIYIYGHAGYQGDSAGKELLIIMQIDLDALKKDEYLNIRPARANYNRHEPWKLGAGF